MNPTCVTGFGVDNWIVRCFLHRAFCHAVSVSAAVDAVCCDTGEVSSYQSKIQENILPNEVPGTACSNDFQAPVRIAAN